MPYGMIVCCVFLSGRISFSEDAEFAAFTAPISQSRNLRIVWPEPLAIYVPAADGAALFVEALLLVEI
jgi:hypothetical protein